MSGMGHLSLDGGGGAYRDQRRRKNLKGKVNGGGRI